MHVCNIFKCLISNFVLSSTAVIIYVLLTHICALTVFSRHKYTYQFTSAAPISILLHDVVLHTEEMKQSAALYMTIVVYSS